MITERKIAALSLCCIFLHLILRFFIEGASSHIFLGIKIFDLPLWVSIGVGGVSLIVGLLKNFFKGVFNTDLLAGISIITAIILLLWRMPSHSLTIRLRALFLQRMGCKKKKKGMGIAILIPDRPQPF